MTKKDLIAYAFIALLLFVIVQSILILSPFLRSILWSSVLCFAFYPIYKSLRRMLRSRDTLAALLMTVLVVLIVLPPFIIIFVNLTAQAVDVYGRAVDFIKDGKLEAMVAQIRQWTFVQNIEGKILEWEPLKQKVSDWILSSSRAMANLSMAQAGVITKNLMFFIVNMFVTFFMLFFMFRDGERIYQYLYSIAPFEEKTRAIVSQQINVTFSAVIRGQLLTSAVQSCVAAVIYGALGIPGPILFGIVTFFTSLIPVLGTWIVWLPLAAYLFIAGSTVKAIILCVLGVFVISAIDNILRPMLIGEKTKLPFILLFLGILGGIKAYGLEGIIIAPIIFSLLFAVLTIYREQYLQGSHDE